MTDRRLLLLIPSSTYKTEDFIEAARHLGADVVVGTDIRSTFEDAFPDYLVTLDYGDLDAAADRIAQLARGRPFGAVVPVDDATTVVAAAIAARLGLPYNAVDAVRAARNKALMRERLAAAGVRAPEHRLCSLDDDPEELAARARYPCVLKPTILNASRGVVRADDPAEFVAAFAQIAEVLAQPDLPGSAEERRELLVERYVDGIEVALEGLLVEGELRVLALFDKPDPLEGPYFEETIYVTPSRLPAAVQADVSHATLAAARALGLRDGPVHAELRIDADEQPWVIEIANRTIGGLCGRTLRFGTGMSLEEIVLRHALRLPIASLQRQPEPAGVMMIPVPEGGGVLRGVGGQERARAVPGVVDLAITAHAGQKLEPMPRGREYLGFLFARAETPAAVEAALREAHAALEIQLEPGEGRSKT